MSETHPSIAVPLASTSCCGSDCCGGATPAAIAGEGDITQAVRTHYGAIAADVLSGARSSCCDSGCCDSTSGDTISQGLYQVDELDGVPLKAALASLGCGNPTALAELHAGETVLDLGSGGGIDVLLSARRVGPAGHAYGRARKTAYSDTLSPPRTLFNISSFEIYSDSSSALSRYSSIDIPEYLTIKHNSSYSVPQGYPFYHLGLCLWRDSPKE